MVVHNTGKKNCLRKFRWLSVLALFFLLILSGQNAQAADLKISLSKDAVALGDLFSARFLVSSPGEAVNALSGVINFDPKKVQVTSLSKAGSVVNLWVAEPEFSNTRGQISFEGAILNPGFSGSAGTIITANFKTKQAGETILSYANGSVLANDGQGTSLLKKLGRVTLNIINQVPDEETITAPIAPEPEEEPVAPKRTTTVPDAPLISSETHPNSEDWYSHPRPRLNWQMPTEIVGVSYLLNREKNSSPEPKSLGRLASYQTSENLEDGVWYFHLRLKNEKGWSQSTHYRLNIDTNAPEGLQVRQQKLDSLDYKAAFDYQATDELSGLKQYEFSIDNNKPEIVLVSSSDSKLYETPVLFPGHHEITVRAVDWAGNKSEKNLKFDIASPLTRSNLYRLGDSLVITLSIIVPLLLLIFALVYIIVSGWRRLKCLKLGIKKEVDEVEDRLHQALEFVKDDMVSQIKDLEKARGRRKLTVLETKIVRRLRTNLKEVEKYLKKEIEDINNKIK